MDRSSLSRVAIVAGDEREHRRAGRDTGAGARRPRRPTKTDPKINEPFKKPDVKGFIKKFESDDREVYAKRHEIVAALGLTPGMAVADVGAGTGLFTRLFAEKVGKTGGSTRSTSPRGSSTHIAAEAKKRGQTQVVTVLGSQIDQSARESVDLVFLCDVYHHLEKPEKTLASIRQALKPEGRLVVIDFDRVEGRSTEFVLKHVRASQDVFRKEIEAAGFRFEPTQEAADLQGELLPAFREVVDLAQAISRLRGGEDPRGRERLSFARHPTTPRWPSQAAWIVRHEARSRPRRRPGFPRRARTTHFLPTRWRAGPTARATPPASRPPHPDRRVGERRSGRIGLDGKATEARRDVRRGNGRRRDFAGLLFIPKQHGEPSLDTPNTRPFSASSQGPKLAHGKPLTAR